MSTPSLPRLLGITLFVYLLSSIGAFVSAQEMNPYPSSGNLYFEDRTTWPVSALIEENFPENHDWSKEDFEVIRHLSCHVVTLRNSVAEGHVFRLRCRLMREAAVIATGKYARKLLRGIRTGSPAQSYFAEEVKEESKRSVPGIFPHADSRCYRYRHRRLTSHSNCEPRTIEGKPEEILSPVTHERFQRFNPDPSDHTRRFLKDSSIGEMTCQSRACPEGSFYLEFCSLPTYGPVHSVSGCDIGPSSYRYSTRKLTPPPPRTSTPTPAPTAAPVHQGPCEDLLGSWHGTHNDASITAFFQVVGQECQASFVGNERGYGQRQFRVSIHDDNLLDGKSRIRIKGEDCWFSLTPKSRGRYKGYGCGGALSIKQ